MRPLLAAVGVLAAMAPAQAACLQELAVYASANEQSGLEFVANSSAMAMRHEVRLLLAGDLVMAGYVGVSGEPAQTALLVPHECPQGDVTGAELDACMVYDSVIYAISSDGDVGNLPARGSDAAATVLLPGFAQTMAALSARFGDAAAASAADVYRLSGCQE